MKMRFVVWRRLRDDGLLWWQGDGGDSVVAVGDWKRGGCSVVMRMRSRGESYHE